MAEVSLGLCAMGWTSPVPRGRCDEHGYVNVGPVVDVKATVESVTILCGARHIATSDKWVRQTDEISSERR